MSESVSLDKHRYLSLNTLVLERKPKATDKEGKKHRECEMKRQKKQRTIGRPANLSFLDTIETRKIVLGKGSSGL